MLALDGCNVSGSYCEQPHLVLSSSDTRPGTVRAAAAFRTYATGVAALSDGSVACLTCTGPVILDGGLHQTRGIDQISPYVAVGPDDAIYALVGGSQPFGNGSHAVAAFTRDGTPRWRAELDIAPLSIIPTSEAIYVPAQSSTAALDPSTGQLRMLPGGTVAAGPGSVFTVDSRTFTSTLTLRRLDPAGAMLWARAWTTSTPHLIVYDAVATRDGGVVVVGRAEATIDFGDRMLEGPAGQLLNFVVAIDATGATQWAFSLPVIYTVRVGLLPNGDVLLAGRSTFHSTGGDGTDSFLSVVTSAGIDHSYDIAGPADQDIEGMSVSSAGVVWLQVSNRGGEDEPDPVMKLAGHSLGDSGSYLIGIAP